MFQKPTKSQQPVVAYRTVNLDRTNNVSVLYHEFPDKASVTDPAYNPRNVVAEVKISGPTAAYVLDTTEDSIYTRTRDVVLRGLSGELTEQEQADVDGLDKLAAAVADAEHLG